MYYPKKDYIRLHRSLLVSCVSTYMSRCMRYVLPVAFSCRFPVDYLIFTILGPQTATYCDLECSVLRRASCFVPRCMPNPTNKALSFIKTKPWGSTYRPALGYVEPQGMNSPHIDLWATWGVFPHNPKLVPIMYFRPQSRNHLHTWRVIGTVIFPSRCHRQPRSPCFKARALDPPAFPTQPGRIRARREHPEESQSPQGTRAGASYGSGAGKYQDYH